MTNEETSDRAVVSDATDGSNKPNLLLRKSLRGEKAADPLARYSAQVRTARMRDCTHTPDDLGLESIGL
jgi:hypothetical protein